MDEMILEAHRDLIDRIRDSDWDVTDTELSVYESPWDESSTPEATVTITARQRFPDANHENDESQFRVQ